LGTTQVTPLENPQAYSAFADGGARISIFGVEQVRTRSGQVLFQHRSAASAQIIANPPLSELNQMLRGVIASGTGVRAAVPGYDMAGKTGTTSDYKDAWFCGFTGGLTTVVWMGRDDASPMRGVTGGGAPAAYWRDFMRAAVKRVVVQPIPSGPPVAAPKTSPELAPPTTTPEPQEGEPNPG
jgi:penicillin-binding protein 1A